MEKRWVHVASDQDYTYLTIHQKRGQIGMDAADVLPHAHGIIVHDCWGTYWKYQDVPHAICCAHLLRELNGVIENHPEQTWAARFKKLLLDMKKVRDKALLSDKDEVSYYHRHKFDMVYDAIIKTAYEENPIPETPANKRGCKKKSKVLNLICRLDNYKKSVCLFIKNLCVPFDNNQAERDLRMENGKSKNQGLRMFPKRRRCTGISYNHELHRISLQAWNKCFHGYPRSAERKPEYHI